MASRRVVQIDMLKGLATLAVVVTHTYAAAALVDNWAVFHVWQAVPIFLVILGVTSSMSFQRSANHDLRRLLDSRYLIRRGVRILAPFAFVWILAAIAGRARGSFSVGLQSALLRLPYGGPGNYFVPLVVAFLLLAPIAYVAYRRWPIATLVAAFALDLAFELAAPHIGLFARVPFLYSIAFPRYLAAFALGLFLADSRPSPRVRWGVLGVGAAASLVYLAIGNLGLWSPPFVPDWRTQNLLAVFYPALLVALGIRWLPSTSRRALPDALARVGRASYHIFLMQMLYFTLLGRGQSRLLTVNLVLTIFLGLGFLESEEWVRARWAQRH